MEERTATKDQVNAVYDLLDGNIREHEKQEQERIVMAHQLDQHDVWLHELAGKAGVELRRST
jgi:hypothetical protein